MRTIGIENKIRYYILTYLEEYKCSANSRYHYYLAFKGDGGNSTIKTHQRNNIDNWSHSGYRPQNIGPGEPDEITVCV